MRRKIWRVLILALCLSLVAFAIRMFFMTILLACEAGK